MIKHVALAVAMILWVGAGAAQAGGLSPIAEKEISKPGVVVTDLLEVKAAIEAIDYKKYSVMLQANQGKTITLKVDKTVRNFEQLKKGDVVLADFVESIAIHLRDAKAPPSPAEARLISVAPKGSKVGVLLAETFPVTGVVEYIDFKAKQVTLKEADGRMRIFPVDKSFKHLDRLSKGETVVARVTEAIAIKLEKRK